MPDENPYKPFRRVRGAVDSAKRVTDERFGAWELGYNARCPEGWIVVRLDEHEARMRECEALRLEREDARAERDAALVAGAEAERARIVEWLRRRPLTSPQANQIAATCMDVANQIERQPVSGSSEPR